MDDSDEIWLLKGPRAQRVVDSMPRKLRDALSSPTMAQRFFVPPVLMLFLSVVNTLNYFDRGAMAAVVLEVQGEWPPCGARAQKCC